MLEPIRNHRGIPFWPHLGTNQILYDKFKRWIHFGVIFGVPKWSKKWSQSRCQQSIPNRSSKWFERKWIFKFRPPFGTLELLYHPPGNPAEPLHNGALRSVNSAALHVIRRPLFLAVDGVCYIYLLRCSEHCTYDLYSCIYIHIHIMILFFNRWETSTLCPLYSIIPQVRNLDTVPAL